MFQNTGAVDKMVNTVGELLDIYETAHDTTSKTRVRAEVHVVESTDFNLIRAGLRPLVDIVANVAHDTDVARGWAVKHETEWYNITRVEDQKSGQGVIVSRRLVLVRISPGGLDMTA